MSYFKYSHPSALMDGKNIVYLRPLYFFKCADSSSNTKKNHSSNQKFIKPFWTKKKYATSQDKKKSCNLLGQKNSDKLLGQKKIMQPLGTKKNQLTS